MKKFLSYLRQSDIIITLFLNPLKWRFYLDYSTVSDHDPGLILSAVLRAGLIKITIIIDDERW